MKNHKLQPREQVLTPGPLLTGCVNSLQGNLGAVDLNESLPPAKFKDANPVTHLRSRSNPASIWEKTSKLPSPSGCRATRLFSKSIVCKGSGRDVVGPRGTPAGGPAASYPEAPSGCPSALMHFGGGATAQIRTLPGQVRRESAPSPIPLARSPPRASTRATLSR